MKSFLKKYPPAFDFFKYLSRKLGNRTELYIHLKPFFDIHKDFSFIQIGANDGISNDPFREFILQDVARGVIVEPQSNEFYKLKNNYIRKEGKIHFENCAISYTHKQITIFVVDEDFLKISRDAESLSGVASFEKDHVLKHIGINNEKYVKSINVPCKTIEDLQSEHSFKSFDCIFMDVEGYEYDILSNMSFELIKPKLIVFESKHLGNKQKELSQFLEYKKYRLSVCDQDTIAIKE